MLDLTGFASLGIFVKYKGHVLFKGSEQSDTLIPKILFVQYSPMGQSLTEFLSSDSSRWKESPILLSLWYDAQGNWEEAHHQVDQMAGKAAARVHAYLHRKEGDQWNADYWYSKAGEKRPSVSLEKEWEELVYRFLS